MKSGIPYITFLILALCMAIAAPNASAQTLGGITNANIKTQPASPGPGESFAATLEAAAYDTTGATISWFVDGEEQVIYSNSRTAKFTAGPLGSTQHLSARIAFPTGRVTTVEHTVKPIRVDLIVESDSSVPTTYEGRALPSKGSTMRVIAVVHTGDSTNPNQLSYNWQVNNKHVYGGPVIGRNIATFETPSGGDVLVAVDIADGSGNSIAQKASVIRPATPEIHFYEDNALRGMSRNTMRDQYQLIGDEITVRAEPFYMSSNIFSQNPLLEWEIDGKKIENPNIDKQTITLRSGGGAGNFKVGFQIRNLRQLLQGADGEFTISF